MAPSLHSYRRLSHNSPAHRVPSQSLIQGDPRDCGPFGEMGVSLSMRMALQFGLPEITYFSLVPVGSVRLSLVDTEKVQSKKQIIINNNKVTIKKPLPMVCSIGAK